jgi:hypothetical protein
MYLAETVEKNRIKLNVDLGKGAAEFGAFRQRLPGALVTGKFGIPRLPLRSVQLVVYPSGLACG